MTPRVHILTPAQFQARFGSETACGEYLARVRWPAGFVCPHCGSRAHSFIHTRRLYQCSACRRQTSLTAGTIFHKSRKPLTLWFWAIYLLAQDKKGCPAILLMKHLDVSYPTAWLMAQKIRQAMASDALPQLDGHIELDDAYLGGARPGEPGRQGRAAVGKTPVLIAVEARTPTAVGRAALVPVRNFRKPTVRRFMAACVAPGSRVKTDWMGGFAQLGGLGYEHERLMQGRQRGAAAKLPLVHRIISNLKRFLLGRHHAIAGKHAQRYLGEFRFRLNHRHDEAHLCELLIERCAKSQVITYPQLCRAEVA